MILSEAHSQKQLVLGEFASGEHYARLYDDKRLPSYYFFRTRLQRIRELIADCRPGKAIDVGCGPGILVKDLVDQGYHAVGVDLSEGMIDECQRRYGHHAAARFVVGDAEALPFEDSCFDLAVCTGVLEYIDGLKAIREAARVLRRDGTLIVSMLNPWSPYFLWQQRVRRPAGAIVKTLRRTPKPLRANLRLYTLQTLAKTVTSLGLEIRDVVYFDFRPTYRVVRNVQSPLAVGRERLGRGPLRSLGNGFILKAAKP